MLKNPSYISSTMRELFFIANSKFWAVIENIHSWFNSFTGSKEYSYIIRSWFC